MAPALGLSLYLLANRPKDAPAVWPPDLPRPAGVLLWVDVGASGRVRAAVTLAEAVLDRGLSDTVLLTCPTPVASLPPDVIAAVLPPENLQQAQTFFAHWRPDAGVQFGGQLRPASWTQALDLRLPMMIVEGSAPQVPGGKWWYPGLVSGLLAQVSMVCTADDAALAEYRRFGVPDRNLHASAPLEESGLCPACTEAERAALARQFGTRPVWLAASVPMSDLRAVIAAHLEALRSTHRLLLILCPTEPARSGEIAALIEGEFGLNVARRSLDDDAGDDVQVYIADTEGEYGLWFRLAPVSFIGGTLGAAPNPAQRHPFEAASLGSSIIHGPFLQPFEAAFGRLRRAGATRIVPSGGDLGVAVCDLLEPDRAARLAQAAWSVLAQSAAASDDALARIETLLSKSAGG